MPLVRGIFPFFAERKHSCLASFPFFGSGRAGSPL